MIVYIPFNNYRFMRKLIIEMKVKEEFLEMLDFLIDKVESIELIELIKLDLEK